MTTAQLQSAGANEPSCGSDLRFLGPQALADYVDVSLQTVYAWNSTGTGPSFYRVGRHVRYRISDVDSWLESRRSGTTAPRADGDLDAHVQRIVADWPALTPEQRDRLAVLLRPSPSRAAQKAA